MQEDILKMLFKKKVEAIMHVITPRLIFCSVSSMFIWASVILRAREDASDKEKLKMTVNCKCSSGGINLRNSPANQNSV